MQIAALDERQRIARSQTQRVIIVGQGRFPVAERGIGFAAPRETVRDRSEIAGSRR
jgi:hypothetical protein